MASTAGTVVILCLNKLEIGLLDNYHSNLAILGKPQ